MSEETKYKLFNPFSGLFAKMMVPLGQLRYYKVYHRWRKLKNPEMYYDKIFWMMRHADLTRWGELADKYAVRDYVTQKCGSEILTKLYGVYDHATDIDFDALPNQFVVKTNNGCASNFIVRDKAAANLEEIREKLDFWLGIHYGELTGQPHYSLIRPRIIAEQLLVQDGNINRPLIDYKFKCFDGFVHSCGVFCDRVPGTHVVTRMDYDMDWNPHPEWTIPGKEMLAPTPRPKCLDQMIDIAQRLSKGFPFVRVDLYCIDDKPYFGEMTFAPGLVFFTDEYQTILGNLIDLSKAKLRK